MLNPIQCLTVTRPQQAPGRPKAADGAERTWRAAPSIALALSASLILQMAAATPAPAQGGAPDTPPAAASEKVIITPTPQQGSRLRAALSKLLGKDARQKLGGTKSEVWTVQESRVERLKSKFKALGLKVTQLGKDWNHILRRRQGTLAMTPAQEAMMKKAQGAREIVGVGVMTAPEAAVAEYALTASEKKNGAGGVAEEALGRIVIPLNDKQHVTVERVKAVTTEKGTTWRGKVAETGESAVLMWWKDGRLSGVFGYKGHIYMIVNMGGDVHAVLETDPTQLPPDHSPSSDRADAGAGRALLPASVPPPPDIKPLDEIERKKLEAKDITIDLMLLYTRKPTSRYIRDPADLLELAVEQANETFRNSGIPNVKLRLVHTQLVDYDETGSEHFEHLYNLVDGKVAFKNIRHLRDEKRADIVGLIVDDPSGCGLSTRVGADAEEAFFVVHHSCAAITISIAHEIGHILGARHDRLIDGNDMPFAYGHGYVNGNKWRDIMSYQKGCAGCPRLPFWSNPRVMYQGEPTGTLANDNARVILEQAERVASFR
ncbi:MAG TPA: M12 family metallo-peptidase [Hyphomicrobiaceae bacterium]|nr:M12 family metallo-peptidase [Hyphomicrobiaceae bacterium]